MPKKSLDQLKTTSPIHQWADVDDYLNRAEVPSKFHLPFHEMIIARGRFPVDFTTPQGQQLNQEMDKIARKRGVFGPDRETLKIIYVQLVSQWANDVRRRRASQN